MLYNTVKTFDEMNGLRDKSTYAFDGNGSYKHQWKIHLLLNAQKDEFPKLDDSRLQKIAKFLFDKKIKHKFAGGGDGYKTFTIYVGSFEQCEALAEELINGFDEDFQSLSRSLKIGEEDSDLNLLNNPNIAARFEGYERKFFDGKNPFSEYGFRGIPRLRRSKFAGRHIAPENMINIILNKNLSFRQQRLVSALVGHCVMAKYCGDNYLGNTYKNRRWDKDIFSGLNFVSADEVEKIIKYVERNFEVKRFIYENNLSEKSVVLDIKEFVKSSFGAAAQRITDKFDKNASNIAIDNKIKEISNKW